MQSHNPPSARSISDPDAMLGTVTTASGQDVTQRATAAIAAIPSLIGRSASASR